MDLFKDKKRDDFDELTQLIEPFMYKYNEIVSMLPDEIELTFDVILSLSGPGFYSVSRRKITEIAMLTAGIKETDLPQNHDTVRMLHEAYEFDIRGNVKFDMSVPEMTGGTIVAVKKAGVKNDEEIKDEMVKYIEKHMISGQMRASDCPAARFHELAESFGFYEEMKKQTTFNGRKRLLRSKITEEFKNNSIRIRDYELGCRFAKWVSAYLKDGNLAALKNIATLKIMSHEDIAIYSINEEEI